MEITDKLLYQYAAEARDIVLSTIPSVDEIPEHKFSKKFERKMNRLIKEQRRSPKLNKAIKYIKRSIAVAAAVIVVTFSGLMTVDAYREKVIEIIVKVFHELTDYKFVSNVSATSSQLFEELPEIEFGYIPEGMECKKQLSNPKSLVLIFENENGTFLEFRQKFVSSDGSHNAILDTEDSESSKIYVNEIETVLNIKDSVNTLIWTEGNIVYRICGNISLDELINTIKNIKNN